MPAFDGTGPQGKGPLTGRGMGTCKGGVGRQEGMGRGFGRRMVRCCDRVGQNPTKQDLENYKNNLKKEMEEVEKEIGSLNK
ncbi:MAG: hypothetical protein US54_C0010G0014 [Candidatus Roizmanbacteria bacterium GW2011_GWA2_37_7]|uniref:Cytoplasmic protein n=1 Tax=Candidatus Roizmanbacteria bacterium GW2011_GWA2_37_7 TaxID=1618481 RepID=A0A0G0H580_9BACT|nr:MAG: hypothetical protein US54_C0010G0014 [Candidatus Roizmanbacteria bacterium GW2011_GWA2_37_7]